VGESSNVTVLDATTLQEMGAVTLPANAQAIAFSADGTRVYITLPTTGQLAVVGAEARTLDGVVDLGGTPHAVAVAANGTVHVTDVQSGSERVLLLDATGQPMHAVRVHRSPAVLAVDDARIYITGPNSDTISLIDPAFPAQGIVDTWALGSGLGEHINWAVRLGGASARLSSTTTPVVQVQGQQAGFAQVRANYIHAGATPAYTFEVRLKPELEQAGVVIRKEQYDLIMNILNAFHPLGVEVNTEAIRPRVVEVREGLLSAFPDYTYPNYRIQHRAARKQETILPRPN
jgi:hypothetical protein